MKKTYKIVTILVHYNEPDYCISIITDLLKLINVKNKIIVVDNNSKKRNYNILVSKYKNTTIKLIRHDKNIGFGGGINIGADFAKKYSPKYLHIINTDTKIINYSYLHTLEKILDSDRKIGIIGPFVMKENGAIQNTIMPFPSLKSILYYKRNYNSELFIHNPIEIINVDVINGVCFLTRFNDFINVDGFDEDYFMYVEEHDYAYKIKKLGLKSVFVSIESIVHFGADRFDKNVIDWKYFYSRRNQVLYLYKRKKFLSGLLLGFFFLFSLLKKRFVDCYRVKNNAFWASIVGFIFPKIVIIKS